MQTFKVTQNPSGEMVKGYLSLQLDSIRRTFEIKDYVNIGRNFGAESDTEIALHDNFVSNRHCRIEQRRMGYCIRDLNSRNGTFLNGTRIQEATLRDGDRVRVGETELAFAAHQTDERNDLLLTSKNSAWQSQLDRLPLIARADLPVLISGPSGSGKEIMAAALHKYSNRRSQPFVSVNCSALAETLVESELFGHAKGSFTGASEDRKGAFVSAKNGTLFLDEIGDLPPSLQPKLLRALENQEVKPVGSDTPIPVNVRILSATHKNLAKMVQKGQFREDLFYRLNVLRIVVPSLHERREDFEDLLKLFGNKLRVTFTAEATAKLRAYGWPGQVRELKNCVARAGALFPGHTITCEQIDTLFDVKAPQRLAALGSSREKLQHFETAMIKEKLVAHRGNIRRTAEALGLPKSTLYDRIKSYGINIHAVLAESYFAAPAVEENRAD